MSTSTRKRPVPKAIREAALAALEWHQLGETVFELGRGRAGYWKGPKGWYASRADQEQVEGPFRTPAGAKAWAEEPSRTAKEASLLKKADLATVKAARQAERDRARKASVLARRKADRTWAGLPEDQHELAPGQVWRPRRKGFENHELLLVRKRKKDGVWICKHRVRPALTWSSKTVARKAHGFTKIHSLVRIEE